MRVLGRARTLDKYGTAPLPAPLQPTHTIPRQYRYRTLKSYNARVILHCFITRSWGWKMLLSRRHVLAGSGACACCASVGEIVQAAPTKSFDGCFISPAAFNKFKRADTGFAAIADGLFARTRHFRSTGDAAVDRDLDRALRVVSDNFSVRPAFGFYDPNGTQYTDDDPERMIMNAWATSEMTDIPGTWGTVAFGWDLFESEFQRHDKTGVSIITIAAHEFAHIWQQKSGNIGRLRVGNPRKSEINADFLAGYFLGTRKILKSSLSFKPAGDLLDRLGASGEGNPDRTHGNRLERLNAAEAGFRIAYVDRRDFSFAKAAGLEYVGA